MVKSSSTISAILRHWQPIMLAQLRFIDVLKPMPKKDNFKARGIMENFSILGNVYILAKWITLNLLKRRSILL